MRCDFSCIYVYNYKLNEMLQKLLMLKGILSEEQSNQTPYTTTPNYLTKKRNLQNYPF